MASIQLNEIRLLGLNPTLYTTPLQFSFSCAVIEELPEALEVRFVWVGSGNTAAYDQVLETLLIGPLFVGINEFVTDVAPPQWDLFPVTDILGDTLLLVSLLYSEREFLRVGYWVHVAYVSDYDNTHPPQTICIDRINRLLSSPTIIYMGEIPQDAI